MFLADYKSAQNAMDGQNIDAEVLLGAYQLQAFSQAIPRPDWVDPARAYKSHSRAQVAQEKRLWRVWATSFGPHVPQQESSIRLDRLAARVAVRNLSPYDAVYPVIRAELPEQVRELLVHYHALNQWAAR